MVKLEISNIEQFRNFFDVVYDVANEILELKFYLDKMTCAVLDKGRVRFFYVEYESKFFDTYGVDEVDSVYVFLEDMYNLLKLANKTDTLILEFNDSLMSAQLLNDGKKRIFEFTLPYEDTFSPEFPKETLRVNVDLLTDEMKQSVKDIKLIGTDIFQFVVSKDNISLMSDSTIATDNFTSTKYAQVIEADVEIDEPLSIRFNLDYVAQMLKFEKISKEVNIQMDERAMFYKFEDDIFGVCVRGMIAPRIEVESE